MVWGGRDSYDDCPLLETGTSVDRYQIEAPLGRGGMGQVYRAFDTRLRRPIALKILHDTISPDAMMRLVREARLAASLSHPNIVAVFDVGEDRGLAYMAMELLHGRQLRELMRVPIPVPDKLRWLVEIARGLAAAHGAGLVHRDVKPQNVMVTASAAKILDFGIAKEIDEAAVKRTALLPSLRTQPGFSMGTPRYMAPEVLRGEYPSDSLTDQFAWGLVACELLVGSLPRREDLEGGRWTPPRIATPDVSARAASVIERTLADDRRERFASMSELADALDACARPLPRTEPQVALESPISPPGADDELIPVSIPDGRGSAAATRMFPVYTPEPERVARASSGGEQPRSSQRQSVAPVAVREPTPEVLAPLVDAALGELAFAVPGAFRRAVAIVTLDVDGGKARFFVQLVATDERGELWTPDASMDVVRAAAETISADARDGNGRWMRLVLALQHGSREASVVSIV
jgi:eukaryotic-like serine/threonine-protein kinase